MEKFNWKLAFLLAFSGIVTNTLWAVFNAYVPIILQAGNPLWDGGSNIVGFALSPTIAYFIMTWDNIIHMIITPWAGARSDYTWNRFGRRKPWLLVGAPFAILGFVLIPYATSIPAIILFILLTNFATSIYRAPVKAWLGDLFERRDRSKVEGLIHLVGGVGFTLTLIVGGVLFDRVGLAAPFWFSAVIVLISVMVVMLIKEPETLQMDDQPQEERLGLIDTVRMMLQSENRSPLYALLATLIFHMAYAAGQTATSSFAVLELGITTGRVSQLIGLAGLVYVFCAFPSGLLAHRIGNRRAMSIGMVAYALINFIAFFIVRSEGVYAVILLLTGLSWAFIFVNSVPLVLNTDEGHNTGVFTGLYFFAFQLANVLGPVLAGAMIQLFSSQRLYYLFVAIFMLVGFLVLNRVEERDYQEVEAILASD